MPPPAPPAHSLLSIEQVAQILNLHVRTVRNYVRKGSLQATRIGKQYRIGLQELEAFTGRPVQSPNDPLRSAGSPVDVSTVITIEGVSSALAAQLATLLTVTAAVLRPIEQPVAVSTSYDELPKRLRVLMAADLKSSRDLLSMIQAALEPDAAPRQSS
jgi:excisionase family DNA binding protein